MNQQRDWQSVLYQNFYSEKQIRLIVGHIKLQEEIFEKKKESLDFEDKIGEVKKEVEKRDRKITNQEELIELSKRNLDEYSKELAEKRELINQLKEDSESP